MSVTLVTFLNYSWSSGRAKRFLPAAAAIITTKLQVTNHSKNNDYHRNRAISSNNGNTHSNELPTFGILRNLV